MGSLVAPRTLFQTHGIRPEKIRSAGGSRGRCLVAGGAFGAADPDVESFGQMRSTFRWKQLTSTQRLSLINI